MAVTNSAVTSSLSQRSGGSPQVASSQMPGPAGVSTRTDGGSAVVRALQPSSLPTGASETEGRAMKAEPFIPVTHSALTDRLAAANLWHEGQAPQARRFFQYLGLWRQQQTGAKVLHLDRIYEPFSPDSDLLVTRTYSDAERAQMLTELIAGVEELLVAANYTRVPRDQLEPVINTTETNYGLDMSVDLDAYEHLVVYYRGDTTKVDKKRHWRKFFRVQEFETPIFRRFFVMFTLKHAEQRLEELMGVGQSRRLALRNVKRMKKSIPSKIKHNQLYLKLFKNIPKADLEMSFPNAAVSFRMWDKLWLGVTSLGAIGMGLSAAAGKLGEMIEHPWVAAGVVGGVGGAAMRQGFNLMNQHRKYLFVMAQNLYFHAMADNRGVMTKLADRAAEEQMKEDMLLYCVLAKSPANRADLPHIDLAIEDYLSQTFDVVVDFDVNTPFERLKADGIITEAADGSLTTLAPAAACARLEARWARVLSELPSDEPLDGSEFQGPSAQPKLQVEVDLKAMG